MMEPQAPQGARGRAASAPPASAETGVAAVERCAPPAAAANAKAATRAPSKPEQKAARAAEHAALLLPFDGVEDAQQRAAASARRCCARNRPPVGWRVALAATSAWLLLVLAAEVCDPLEIQACAGAQPWWAAGVIYQARVPQTALFGVYPRSFQDSDGDGVGDLKGILQRIDYIESLNVSAIWLSPVFPSPMRDFGYDVSDFKDIHPLFGTLADLDALVAAAHARGLRVLLDLVPNHTSDVHPWFVESASSRTSSKRDWYVWVEAPEGNSTAAGPPGPPPNNWRSFFGGSAWSWDTNTRAWYLHQYLPSQPDLNWRSEGVQAAFGDIMRFWQHRGIDGFRIDSLPTLLEDDMLKDEPANPAWRDGMDPHDSQLHINYTQDVYPIHQLVHGLREVADEGRSVLVCETRLSLNELKQFYGSHLHECQLPFNFELVEWDASWNATRLKAALVAYLAGLPRGATPDWVLGNHDNARVATRLGGERPARAALMLLMALPGTPTVYYGEEIGMTNVELRDDQVRDPAALRQPRELWPVVGRDPERTPMQWDASRAAGFLPPDAQADAQPWLPLAPDAAVRNVAAQQRNATSTLALFRTLASLRRAEPALRGAPLVPLDWAGSDAAVPDTVVAFARPLRCACGNVTTPTTPSEPTDDAEAPAPSPAPPAPPAQPPVPRFNATSFVFVLNMGTEPATLNVASAMARAGLGVEGWDSPLLMAVDSDTVDAHAAERVDSTAVTVQPWAAVLLSVRLVADPSAKRAHL